MMRRIIIVSILMAALVLAGCGNEVKNQGYIDELRASGADEEKIEELIEYEKTNDALPDGGYVDTTGKTAAEAAEEQGMTFEEYIEEYDLPKNLPELVSENEAGYTVPVSKMAEIYGMSFEEFKQMLNLPENVTEETTWGEALGEVTIGDYIGEENVESFKENYGLSSNVDSETKWKEIREIVDEAKRDARLSENSETESE